jgi:hypothetical protein
MAERRQPRSAFVAFFEAIELRFGEAASLISFVPSQATDAIATQLAAQRELED